MEEHPTERPPERPSNETLANMINGLAETMHDHRGFVEKYFEKAIDSVKSGKYTPQQVEERIQKLPEEKRKKLVEQIKKLNSKEKSANTKASKTDMLPYYVKLMELRQSDPAKAQEVWNKITPENKKALNLLIKQYDGLIP